MNPSRAESGERGWLDHELVPISALEHYSFCPRQAALIHGEAVWEENLYTLRGRMVHAQVDQPGEELCGPIRVVRALPLWSSRLGLVGKADVVEFHGETPYPLDYKHGRLRDHPHAALQLCAQAVCLEEMFQIPVLKGAVYHASSRRRREVTFDAALRRRLLGAVAELREMLIKGRLPPPVSDRRCRHCSLKSSCLPRVVGDSSRVAKTLRSLFRPEV